MAQIMGQCHHEDRIAHIPNRKLCRKVLEIKGSARGAPMQIRRFPFGLRSRRQRIAESFAEILFVFVAICFAIIEFFEPEE